MGSPCSTPNQKGFVLRQVVGSTSESTGSPATTQQQQQYQDREQEVAFGAPVGTLADIPSNHDDSGEARDSGKIAIAEDSEANRMNSPQTQPRSSNSGGSSNEQSSGKLMNPLRTNRSGGSGGGGSGSGGSGSGGSGSGPGVTNSSNDGGGGSGSGGTGGGSQPNSSDSGKEMMIVLPPHSVNTMFSDDGVGSGSGASKADILNGGSSSDDPIGSSSSSPGDSGESGDGSGGGGKSSEKSLVAIKPARPSVDAIRGGAILDGGAPEAQQYFHGSSTPGTGSTNTGGPKSGNIVLPPLPDRPLPTRAAVQMRPLRVDQANRSTNPSSSFAAASLGANINDPSQSSPDSELAEPPSPHGKDCLEPDSPQWWKISRVGAGEQGQPSSIVAVGAAATPTASPPSPPRPLLRQQLNRDGASRRYQGEGYSNMNVQRRVNNWRDAVE